MKVEFLESAETELVNDIVYYNGEAVMHLHREPQSWKVRLPPGDH